MKKTKCFVQNIEFRKSAVTGFALDNEGTVFISDFTNMVYQLHDTVDKVEQSFSMPGECVALTWKNDTKTLYMCDCNHKIWKLQRDSGDVTLLVGSAAGHKDGNFASAQFFYPRGIAFDKDDNLLVTDQHCIRKISLRDQTVITMAGCPPSAMWKSGSHKDGQSSEAKFNSPTGIAVSKEGIIYVSDSKNHCIRKIENGFVSTIAGISKQPGQCDGSLEEARFKLPRGIYLDEGESLLVADSYGLRKLDFKKNKVTTIIEQPDCFAVSKDKDGNILLGAEYKLLRLYQTWDVERYLWIGVMKEDPSLCPLATLPRDMVKEIAAHLKPVGSTQK